MKDGIICKICTYLGNITTLERFIHFFHSRYGILKNYPSFYLRAFFLFLSAPVTLFVQNF